MLTGILLANMIVGLIPESTSRPLGKTNSVWLFMVFSIHLACHYDTIQGSVLGKKGIKIRKSKKNFSFKTQFYNCQLSTVINLMQVLLDPTELIPCVFSNAWTLNRPWIYCVSSHNMLADLSKRLNVCNAVKEYCPAGLGFKHLLNCRWFFNQKPFKRIKLSRYSNLERWSQ